MRTTNYFKGFDKKVSENYVITNLLNRAKIKNVEAVIGSRYFDPYVINDGERPETIAEAYYGSTSYFWIILFANNIKNIYEEWPKSTESFNKYIISKYRSIEYAQLTTHHFEDSNGNFILQAEWDGTESNKINVYDWELHVNDSRRLINLIKPEYKDQISREFQNIFR
jgi:hypothetical protein